MVRLISYVAPLMLFVRSGYPSPLPHILIVQSLQESIRGATYLRMRVYFQHVPLVWMWDQSNKQKARNGTYPFCLLGGILQWRTMDRISSMGSEYLKNINSQKANQR